MRQKISLYISFVLVVLFFLSAIPTLATSHIADGDLLTAKDSFDIYIVKLVGAKKFKRLILNPEIFNSYGHLKWENVKTVSTSTLAEYTLSEFVIEVNPDGTVYDPKVYRVSSTVNSDAGERRWLNITTQEFESLGYDWDSIYHINHVEAAENFYKIMPPLTYEILKPPVKPVEKAAEVPQKQFRSADCNAEVPTSHATIQSAIDSSKSGDKICLLAGTYEENVKIDGKAVILSGADALTTKIKAKREGNTLDTYNPEKNSAVVIKNVSLQTIIEKIQISNGDYYGIWLYNASPVIKNNIISDNFAGIRIFGNSRPDIRNNVFLSNTHGNAIVHNSEAGDYEISHNTFIDNGNIGASATILFDAAFTNTPIKVINNIFKGGVIGIHEAVPTNSLINNNLFYGQSVNYVRKMDVNYNSVSPLNDLTFADNNIASDPVLDSAFRPRSGSPAIDAADDRKSNIGAY